MPKYKVKPEFVGKGTIVLVDNPAIGATIKIDLDVATSEELEMIVKGGEHHMIVEDKKQPTV